MFSFTNYTRDNGFPVKLVSSTTQDKYGFIWFATEHNLIRYDGSTYKIYRHENGDSLSIPESPYYDLHCRADGMLLMVYDRGICCYDYDQDRFTRLISNDTIRMVGESFLYVKSTGIWFAAADRKLHCYDPVKRTTRTFAAAAGYISSMFIDSRNNFWIGTHDGLYQFDQGRDKYELRWHSTTDLIYGSSMVTSIVEDEDGKIWFNGYNSGFYRMDPATGQTAFFDFRPYHWRIHPFFALNDLILSTIAGRPLLFASSQDGMVVLDRSTGKITLVRHDPADQSSILSDDVTHLFKDNTGEIWVTTPIGMSKTERLFTNFRSIPLEGLDADRHIRTICSEPRKSTIWMAIDSNGLLQYDWRNHNLLRRIPVLDQHGRPLIVHHLYLDRSGRLWLGTNEGVGILDTISGKISWPGRTQSQADTAHLDRFATSEVYSKFIEDGNGNIWVGTVNGISIYSPDLRFVKNLAEEKGKSGGLQGKQILSLYPNGDHQVWIATKTMNLYDENTGAFVNLPKTTLPRFAQDITDDGKGNFYFTSQSAVYQYKRATDSFYLPWFNNFIEPSVSSTFSDSRGCIWFLNYGSGLLRIDPADTSLRRFTRRKGLLNNGLVEARTTQPGGPVFLVGDNGLQYFYPDSVQTDTTPAPLRISGISLLETLLRAGYQRFSDSALSVSYRQNVIRFEFGLLDYSFTEDITYQYRLDGFDKDWIDANHARSATYTNLDHGDYVFRVRARNHDGYDNGTEARVMLHIVPPFWKTWWFLTALALLSLGLLYAWIRSLQQNLRDQKILNRFATSLYGSNSIEDIFRNVANDCVTQLGCLFCRIHTGDEKIDVQWQKAETGKTEARPSFITVPINVDGKDFGVIEATWPAKKFRTRWHLRMLQQIAATCRSKLTLQVMQDRIRDKIARDLHDDMGSTLSSINILSKMALENAGGAQQVNTHLTRIRDNSANMMETMSDIVWAINSANDTMEKLIFRMKEFASDMLDPLNIRYDLRLEGDFRTIRLDLDMRRDFYLVFKEAVNNAAKYSGCSHIGILLSHLDSHLEMQVSDNGNGFDPQQIRSGNGLANMQERARQMGGEVSVVSGHGMGTTIRLTIRSHE